MDAHRDFRSGWTLYGTRSAVLDAGLRSYMLRVYNWMAAGLLLTAAVSYLIAETRLLDIFYPVVATVDGVQLHAPSALAWIAMITPLGFVLVLSFGVNRLSLTAAQALFWLFCATMGASLTTIFISFTQQSILATFVVTAVTFAGMSLYAYTTNADLSRLGSFLIMGAIGLLIAMVVNIFLHSSALQFAVSAIGVLVFTGLAAYDTQRIKTDYIEFGRYMGPEIAARRSVYDALQLYLSFINLFMFLLQFIGLRRN